MKVKLTVFTNVTPYGGYWMYQLASGTVYVSPQRDGFATKHTAQTSAVNLAKRLGLTITSTEIES